MLLAGILQASDVTVAFCKNLDEKLSYNKKFTFRVERKKNKSVAG